MVNESILIDNEAACKNCETELSGHYCSSCGQPDKHLDPSLHDLFHELTHEFLHLDGKIVSTLKLLVMRPGRLTAEFLSGRRARYIGPVRLYLTMSLLFFLVLGMSGDKSNSKHEATGKETTEASHSTSPAEPAAESAPGAAEVQPADAVTEIKKAAPNEIWLQKIAEKATKDPEVLRHAILTNISRVMFVIVPLFALGLKIAYRNRKRRYPSFVYFALHYHSFVFLALSIALLLGVLHVELLKNLAIVAVLLWMPVYLFVAQRRVFGGSFRNTAVRMLALSAFYLACLGIGVALAAGVALYMM